MLQAFDLSYSPDPRVGPLFEHIALSLNHGDKAALVGRNGAGKSLLLRILAGRLSPTRGRVVYAHGTQLGYLAQDFDPGVAGCLAETLERDGQGIPPHAIARAIARLGLTQAVLNQEASTLSLGERMRGALALLLAGEPDLLLLDEPTNHLDVNAREWLEAFLRDIPEAVLIVCHDRRVINAFAERVFELDQLSLTEYAGGFDDMRTAKSLSRQQQLEAWQRHRDEDRRLRLAAEQEYLQASKVAKKPTSRTYDPKHKAFYAGKQAKMDKRAKAIRTRVETAREHAPDKPFVEESLALTFPCKPFRGAEALTVRALSKGFGGRTLFENLNLTLDRGARIAVVGANGCGKTTLFRILLNEEKADGGRFAWAPGTQVAVLSQGRDALPTHLSAIEALNPITADRAHFARTALARLGMRGEIGVRPISVLSVGERTKVEIVSMLMGGANVLILDEPTNHLDLASVEALESALVDFPGAILFTSHDREFVNRLATEVIALPIG